MPGRHFVLNQPAKSNAATLLARVVLDIKDPLRAFAPREAAEGTSTGRNPQDIIPNFMPTPLLSTDRKDFIQTTVSDEGRTGLADFFGFNIARNNEEKLTLESKIVKLYSLDQTKDVFNRLMEDPVYNSEVRKFLKDHGVRKAFFVVGLITTEGSVWVRERTRRHSAGINAQVPLPSVTATPIPGPLHMSTSDNNVHKQIFSSKESLIFAVAYDVVKLKRKVVPVYPGDDVVLGPAKYAKAKHLTMGPEEDGIIEEEEEEEEENLDEDAVREDDVELGGDLDLEEIDFDGLSFNVL